MTFPDIDIDHWQLPFKSWQYYSLFFSLYGLSFLAMRRLALAGSRMREHFDVISSATLKNVLNKRRHDYRTDLITKEIVRSELRDAFRLYFRKCRLFLVLSLPIAIGGSWLAFQFPQVREIRDEVWFILGICGAITIYKMRGHILLSFFYP
jgi:hypothetical protein